MKELVFFLEEPSAAAMLEGVLPRIIGEDLVIPRLIAFEGKQDLEQQLVRRIRGYRTPGAKFIVMRDQDSHPDCTAIKDRIGALCERAGRSDCLVRIACHELESFYLADLAAVEHGLALTNISTHQLAAKFRNP